MRCVPRVRKVCGYGMWFYGCACASRAYGYFMVCGLCGDDATSSQKSISCGVRFFICKGMKNCRITQVFQQVFLGFFLLLFPLLFQSVFPLLFLSFSLPFPYLFQSVLMCHPLLQKWPLSPSVTSLREISQAFPCRTLLRICPLSRTGDRRLIFQSPSLDTPRFYCCWRYWTAFLPLFAEKRCVLGRCGANHWRGLDFTAAGACFRGYFRHGGRRGKNVCKCLILLWLGCYGWMWRLGLDLLVQQLRTMSDASEFSNEVLDCECVSLSSCVSTHHRTIAPSYHLCVFMVQREGC